MQNPFGKSAISMCDRLRNSFVVLQYSNNSATRLVRQIYVASITISTKNQRQQQQPTTKAMKWHVECIKLPFIWFLFSPLPRHCPTFYCCRLYICVLLPSFGSDLLLFFAVAYFWEHLNNVYICTPWICIVFWYLSKVFRVVTACGWDSKWITLCQRIFFGRKRQPRVERIKVLRYTDIQIFTHIYVCLEDKRNMKAKQEFPAFFQCHVSVR